MAMRLKIFLLVAELTTAEVFLHLQSVRPRRVLVEEVLAGQLVETGCKFLGTEVLYQCSLNEVTDAPQAIPQLFSLRVDCRGADGDFRNLTLFDNQQVCGRMGYKKYGRNSGHIRSPSMRLPFLSDRIITLEKEDVIDIQCVLLPFSEDDFFKETWWKEGSVKFEGGGYRELKTIMPFRLILDGDIENTPGKVGAFNFLTASAAGPDACQDAIFRAYKWTVTLHETQKNTHWIRISSPKLGLPKLPKVDLPEFQEGDLGFVAPAAFGVTTSKCMFFVHFFRVFSMSVFLFKINSETDETDLVVNVHSCSLPEEGTLTADWLTCNCCDFDAFCKPHPSENF